MINCYSAPFLYYSPVLSNHPPGLCHDQGSEDQSSILEELDEAQYGSEEEDMPADNANRTDGPDAIDPAHGTHTSTASVLLPPDDSFDDDLPAPVARRPLTSIPEPDKLALMNRAASLPEHSIGRILASDRAGGSSSQAPAQLVPPLRPASFTGSIRSQPSASLTTIATLLSAEGRQRQQQGPISARVSRASSSTSLHPPPSSEPSSLLEALRDELLAEENSSTWGRGDKESSGVAHSRMGQVASAITAEAPASDRGLPSFQQGGQTMHSRSRSDLGGLRVCRHFPYTVVSARD